MSQGTTFAARARAAELNSARAAAAAKEAMTSGAEDMVYSLMISHTSFGRWSIDSLGDKDQFDDQTHKQIVRKVVCPNLHPRITSRWMAIIYVGLFRVEAELTLALISRVQWQTSYKLYLQVVHDMSLDGI